MSGRGTKPAPAISRRSSSQSPFAIVYEDMIKLAKRLVAVEKRLVELEREKPAK